MNAPLPDRAAHLANQMLSETIAYITANRRGKHSDLFRSAEERVSRISSLIASLSGLSDTGEPARTIPHAGEFDMFLAHNSRDKASVRIISSKIENYGISTWLDEKDIPPGQLFQDYIQKALPKAKSIAVFVGPSGLGKWQAFELRSAISRAVEEGIPVIPVLLPNAKDVSSELPFLMEFNYVKFKTLEDEEALQRLIWGTSISFPLKNVSVT